MLPPIVPYIPSMYFAACCYQIFVSAPFPAHFVSALTISIYFSHNLKSKISTSSCKHECYKHDFIDIKYMQIEQYDIIPFSTYTNPHLFYTRCSCYHSSAEYASSDLQSITIYFIIHPDV